MKIATGKIVGGKVVLDGEPLAEGAVVTVIAREGAEFAEITEEEEKELQAAIEQADRGEVVSWNKLRAQLQRSE